MQEYFFTNRNFDIVLIIFYNKHVVGSFRKEGGGNHGLHTVICIVCCGKYSWLLYLQVVRRA